MAYLWSRALLMAKFETTLHLERNYNWTGLLVEPNPRNFHDILQKSRHCWKFKRCLSPVPFATHLPLTFYGSGSEILDMVNGHNRINRRKKRNEIGISIKLSKEFLLSVFQPFPYLKH